MRQLGAACKEDIRLMRSRKQDAAQKSIDFDWCRRDRTIRDCQFQTLYDKHGDPVSMTSTKMVLMIINSHAGGREAWVSFKTLSEKSGRGLRTVKRAVEALVGAGVLLAEYRRSQSGRPCNHYRIIWSELAVLVPKGRVPVLPVKSASSDREECHRGTQSLNEATKEAPPPTPKRKPDAGWRKVEEDFGTIGAIRLLVSQYRKDGQSPDDLRRDIRDAYEVVDLPANAGKITSRDGAVFTFLKTGNWPTKYEMLSKASQEEHAARLADMERLRIEADRARQAKSDAYDAKMDILEAEHGDELDAMTQDEMAILIGNDAKANHIVEGRAGMFRDELLERLAARRQFAAIG